MMKAHSRVLVWIEAMLLALLCAGCPSPQTPADASSGNVLPAGDVELRLDRTIDESNGTPLFRRMSYKIRVYSASGRSEVLHEVRATEPESAGRHGTMPAALDLWAWRVLAGRIWTIVEERKTLHVRVYESAEGRWVLRSASASVAENCGHTPFVDVRFVPDGDDLGGTVHVKDAVDVEVVRTVRLEADGVTVR